MLLAAAGCVPAQEVCYFTGVGMSTLRNMEKAGLVTFSQEEALRLPPPRTFLPGRPSYSAMSSRQPFPKFSV